MFFYINCKILCHLSTHQFALRVSLKYSTSLPAFLPPSPSLPLPPSLPPPPSIPPVIFKLSLSSFRSTLFQCFSPSSYFSFIIPSSLSLSDLVHCLHHLIFLNVFTIASRYLQCHLCLPCYSCVVRRMTTHLSTRNLWKHRERILLQ